MVHLITSRSTLYIVNSASLNYMFSFAGKKDRSEAKHIWPCSKDEDRKKPHPETGSMWVSDLAKAKCTAYESKFKEKHGQTSDPSTEDFDVEVAVLAGQGRRHGQLWIGGGCVDPRTIPSLCQVRSGRTSDQPRVEVHTFSRLS